MKKSCRPLGQKTLFQTWNKQASKSTQGDGKSLFETWGKQASSSSTVSNNPARSLTDVGKLDDIINIDDDEDDDELLAAVDKMDTSCQEGNLSFSARPCTVDDKMDDEIIPGFDSSTGNCWIYPTNYPIRDYQYNIVREALFQNTLVTLPTGLGKTFIAAVVMYNFYRWYPQGKIIFMAPTKPLVAQQIDACYNIMGIPQCDTAEMTGNMAPSKREHSWTQKRVFFLTPQVFQNDLSRGSCRADDVVCLVFDEAHKALGNHAYCQVVREVLGYNQKFRVLALSATPGDGIKAVQQVVTNLLISHIELRSEDSVDIKPYTHQRQVEKIVIKLGEELQFFKTKFLRILNVVISRLFRNKVIWQRDAEKVSKYMLLTAREQFRKNCAAGQQSRHQMGGIEGDFAVAISFYHAYELLLQHGLLPFYNFMKGIVDGTKGSSRAKTELMRNPEFVAIMEDLREQIELPPDQCDGNVTMFSEASPKRTSPHNRPKMNPSFVGHPKLNKLKDIVLEHFRAHESSKHAEKNTAESRVMIFSQFRDSVQEIACMFDAHRPLVRVMSFIGQQSKGNSSKGLTQKEQLEVIRKFRSGGYNTLVATCVGEEGLDIGEVDLIICFDASASPIRLVQRMGRTGRKRAGRIVVLVTEGKEEQTYQRSQRNKSNIHKTILESARTLDLYFENPRMVPRNVNPVCQKMFITVDKISPRKSRKPGQSESKKSGGNIKKLLSTTVTARKDDGFLSPQELCYWHDNFKLPRHEAGLTPSRSITERQQARKSLGQQQPEHVLSLTEWTAWQTSLQPFSFVNHSKRTRFFTEILEFCDFRRDCGEEDDTYDLEMQSFFNTEDIEQPGDETTTEMDHGAGTSGCAAGTDAKELSEPEKQQGKKRKKKNIPLPKGAKIGDQGGGTGERLAETGAKLKRQNDQPEEILLSDKEDDCENHVEHVEKPVGAGNEIRKTTESLAEAGTRGKEENSEEKLKKKKKKKVLLSDNEDDFECQAGNVACKGAETKKAKENLRESRDEMPPMATNLSLSKLPEPCVKVKNPSKKRKSVDFDDDFEDDPFSSTRPEKVSKSDSSRGILPLKKQRKNSSSGIVEQAYNTGGVCEDSNSDNDLSKLLDIPCSQPPPQRNLDKIPAFDVVPDAPSLDALHDLSALNTGECSLTRSGSSDVSKDALREDPEPTVFPHVAIETPKTSKRHPNDYERNNSWKKRTCKNALFNRMLSDQASDEEETCPINIKASVDPEKTGKSKKGNLTVLQENSRKSGINGIIPRRSFENHEKTNDEDLRQEPEECQPGGKSATFRSSWVSNVETTSKAADRVKSDFDAEFGNSFSEDDDTLCDFQTPSLFDNDFDDEELKISVMDLNNTITDAGQIDREAHTIHYRAGRKAKIGGASSTRDPANSNSMVKAVVDRNETNELQDYSGTCRESLNNKRAGAVDEVSGQKVVPISKPVSSKQNLTVRRMGVFKFPSEGASGMELSSVKSVHRTDRGNSVHTGRLAAVKSFASEGCSEREKNEMRSTVLSKERLQNDDAGKKTLHEVPSNERKANNVIDRSLTKIQSFSFGKTEAKDTLHSNTQACKSPILANHSDPVLNGVDEDSDVVAPSPQRVKLSRSFCIGSKISQTKPKPTPLFSVKKSCSVKSENAELNPGRIRKKMLKLGYRSKLSSEEIKLRSGFSNDDRVERPKDQLEEFSYLASSATGETENKKKRESPLYPPLKTDTSTTSAEETVSYTNVCLQNIQPSQGFSNDTAAKRATSNFKKPSNVENSTGSATQKGFFNVDAVQASVDPECEDGLTQFEEDSPVFAKRAKSKNTKESRGTVLESEESEGENDKQKETKKSKQKGDESLAFNGQFFGRNSFGDFESHLKRPRMTDSDSEFEEDGKSNYPFRSFNRKLTLNGGGCGDDNDGVHDDGNDDGDNGNRRELPAIKKRISKKRKAQERLPFARQFFEQEAEVSDDIDIHASSDEVVGDSDEELDDSFIDDRTQLTQRSPLTMTVEKNKRQSVDMMDIYRKSLLTPHREQLRFRTPAFHRFKNRYKMVYNKGCHGRSSSSSQAEVDEEDSFEVVDGSCGSGEEGVSEQNEVIVTRVSSSPEESQVVVQRNRPRKKRVLPASPFESPEGLTEIEKHTAVSQKLEPEENLTSDSRDSLRKRKGPTTGRIVGRSTISENFREPFSVFRRPTERIASHEKKVVKLKTNASTEYENDEKMDDILAALEESDDSLMMEICGIPSFSSTVGISSASKTACSASHTTKMKLISNESVNDRNKTERTTIHPNIGVNSSNLCKTSCSELYSRTKNEKPATPRADPCQKGNSKKIFSFSHSSTLNYSTNGNEPYHPGNKVHVANKKEKAEDVSSGMTGPKKEAVPHLKPRLSDSAHPNRSWSVKVWDKNVKKHLPCPSQLETNSSSALCEETGSRTTESFQATTFEKTVNVGTSDREKNEDVTVITSPALTAAQRDKNKLTVLVGSKEVSNCQIVSFLRRNHNIKAVVSQIAGCDYIVSNRMGVERRLVSDISNPANANKLTERIRELCDLYDRPCLVIEKDRPKQGETENKFEVRSRYFDRVLACLSQTHVKVLFTDSQEGTANILASLAQIEAKKNAAIIYPLPLSKEKEQVMKFLCAIPRTSYITALSLCYHNKSLQEIANSSAEALVKRTKNLSVKRANDIIKFLQHTFRSDMVSSGNR